MWAVVLTVVATAFPQSLHTFVIVCLGWVIGWTSATIARSVYPPPARKPPAGAAG